MKIPSIDLPITAGKAAAIIGVTVQKFTCLVSAGILPQCAPRRYHAPTVTRAYLAHVEATAPDAGRERVRRETEVEKLKLARATADMAAKKLEILNRQFAPRAEIEAALAPVLDDAEKFLRAGFGGKFARRCVGLTAPEIKAETQDILDRVINAVRNGASPELEAAEMEGKA